MKKTVKLFAVSLVIIVIVAAGIRITGNKIEEAYNKGFNDGIEHTITNAVVWVAKVSNGGYNIHIEINGEEYIHFASELAEEVE